MSPVSRPRPGQLDIRFSRIRLLIDPALQQFGRLGLTPLFFEEQREPVIRRLMAGIDHDRLAIRPFSAGDVSLTFHRGSRQIGDVIGIPGLVGRGPWNSSRAMV